MCKIPIDTLFIGKRIIFLHKCDSTNTFSMHYDDLHKVPEGTVVVAQEQTKGRGQRTNSWHAECGKNLTFSILLRPSFLAISDAFFLSKAISLGVWRYVTHAFGEKRVRIKWPNDILLDGEKIGGLLLENTLQHQYMVRSVIGIGLNINQENFHEFRASSLYRKSGSKYNLSHELGLLLKEVEHYYVLLRKGQLIRIKKEYLSALFGLGDKRIFEAENQRFEGVIVGVDPSGRLKIDVQGTVQVYCNGEINFIL